MFRFLRKTQTKFFKVVSLWVICALLFPLISPPAEALFGWGSDKKEPTGPSIERLRVVSMWVEESLLENGKLEDKIERYAYDIQQDLLAKVVLIPVKASISPYEIFQTNARIYFSGIENDQRSQLVGTVLIGELPLPVINKEGNLWPTIFPYVDFVEPVYIWNTEEKQFFYKGAPSHEPEIWHGVIRSDYEHSGKTEKEIQEDREEELEEYFDRNHAYRTGTMSYGKRVFWADLPAQKLGLSETLERYYDRFITSMEDVLYQRYNKHWYQAIDEEELELQEDLILSEETDPAKLSVSMEDILSQPVSDLERQTGEAPLTEEELADMDLSTLSGDVSMSDDDYAQIADTHTKSIISAFLKRYLQAFTGTLSGWNARVQMAGRWTPTETDSTIAWVSRKDEASGYLLKATNDLLEERLVTVLENNNITADISVPRRTFFQNGTRRNPNWTSYPLYWNGVKREGTDFDVHDCSLNRGTLANESYPFAAMIEANRTYNYDTLGDCTDSAFCCAQYLDFEDNGMPISTQCVTTSSWPTESTHEGATIEVFDLKGTKEVTSGAVGASGCASIMADNTYDEITADKTVQTNSLMLHTEPTNETIQTQIEAFNVLALPIDDPRSFSFYDQGQAFQQVKFFNVFDLRNLFSELTDRNQATQLTARLEEVLEAKRIEINDIITVANTDSDTRFADDQVVQWPGADFEAFSGYDADCSYSKTIDSNLPNRTIEWTRTCNFEETNSGNGGGGGSSDTFQEVDTLKRIYGVGSPLSEYIFTSILDQVGRDEIIEALQWVDRDIAEKNRLVFDASMDTPSERRAFLFDQGFNGYELAQITGDRFDGDTLDLAFERGGGNESQEVYELTKQEALSFELEKFEEISEEQVIPEVTELLLTPNRLQLSAEEVTPQKLEVQLLDKDQQPINISQGSVSLSLPEAAQDFFRLTPGEAARVKEGIATFWVIPKARGVAQEFEAVAQWEDLVAETDITFTTYTTKLLADKYTLQAGSEEGITIEALVQDRWGQSILAFDGKMIEASVESGTIVGDAVATIDQGKARWTYIPGREAQEELIFSVQDVAQNLPPQQVHLKVIPASPALLTFETEHEYLIRDGGWVDVKAKILDAYGNVLPVNEHREWIWEIEGGELQSDNGPQVMIRPDRKSESVRLQVWTNDLGPDRGRAMNLQVEDRGKFSVTTSSLQEMTAGETETISFDIQTQTLSGETLQAEVPLGIFQSDGKNFPQTLLERGMGKVVLPVPKTAGEYSVHFTSFGFEPSSWAFKVLPAEPTKIILEAKTDLYAANSVDDFEVQVSVVDRHDNVVPTFNGTIQVRLNDTKFPVNLEKDDLVDQDIIDKNDPRADYLDSLEDSEHTSDTDLLAYASTTVQITNGRAIINYTAQEKLGKAYLTARGADLVPGYFEFDVGSLFGGDQLKNIVPHSLFLLLLAFPGGSPVFESNLANRFLFDGSVQSVATLITAPSPRLKWGIISEAAGFSKDLNAQVLFAEQPEIKITSQEEALAQLRLVYEEPVEFKRVVTSQAAAGAYFQPSPDLEARLSIKDRTVYFDQEKLFGVTEKGGLTQYFGNLFFQSQGHSLLDWSVSLGAQPLGSFTWVLEENDQEMLAQRQDLDQTAITEVQPAKILIKLLQPELRLEDSFTGSSTLEAKGKAIVSLEEEEAYSKILGSPKMSVEEAGSGTGVWEGNWKPATLFAAGQTIGEATRFGASDVLLVLGDPTVKLATKNASSTTGFTEDTGELLWKIQNEAIEQILLADLNNDGQRDIFARVDKDLFGLLQTEVVDDGLNLTDMGPVLRFADGVKKLLVYEDENGNFIGFLQVNESGEVILHASKDGVMTRSLLDLGTENPVADIQVADLDGDGYPDLVITDESNNLYTANGQEDGSLGSAEKLDQLKPKFTETKETYTRALTTQEGASTYERESNPTLDNTLVTMPGIENYLQPGAKPVQTIDGKDYYRLTDTTAFDAELSIKNKEGQNTVVPGDALDVELSLASDEDFTGVSVIMPDLEGQDITMPDMENMTLSKGEKKKIQGTSTITDVPNLSVQITDDNGDGRQDIGVPQGNQVTRYNSRQDQGRHSQSFEVIIPPTTSAPEVTLSSQEAAVATKSEDTDNDGIPDDYDDRPDDANNAQTVTLDTLSDLQTTLDSMADSFMAARNASVCGGKHCGGVSTISVASSTAPGLNIVYEPPLAAMKGTSPGFPDYARPTSRKPRVWRRALAGWDSRSTIRRYEMTTSTGADATAICTDKYPKGMAYPTFIQNCMLTTKPVLKLESCEAAADPGNTNFLVANASGLAEGSHGSVFSVGTSAERVDSSQFTIKAAFGESEIEKYKFNLTNNTLKGVDDVTRWLQQTFEELSNIKMPSVKIILPRFPVEGEDEKEVLLPEYPGADLFHFPEERHQELDQLTEVLENLPFVILRKEKLVIPYPEINAEEFELTEKVYQEIWEPKMGTLLTRLKTEQSTPEHAVYIKQLETIQQTVKTNLQTIRDYQASVKELHQIPQILTDRVKDIQANIEVMRTHFTEFFEYIDQTVGDWEQYYKKLQATYRQWETIVDVFQYFAGNQFPKCTIDRGKVPDFVIRNVFLKGVQYPKITSPKLPSYLIDFSRTEMSVELDIPDIAFEPVEVELPGLPTINFADSFLTGSSLSELPVLGQLPALKPVIFDPQLPVLELPDLKQDQLKKRPTPPKKIFEDLTNLLNTGLIHKAKKYYTLIGKLQINVTKIPEWYIKPHLEQLTNRTKLIDQDFSQPVLYEVAPREEVKDIEVPVNLNGLVHSTRGMTRQIRAIAHQFSCTVGEIPLSLRDPRYRGPRCGLFDEAVSIKIESEPEPQLISWQPELSQPASKQERLQNDYDLSKIVYGKTGAADLSEISLASLLLPKGSSQDSSFPQGMYVSNFDPQSVPDSAPSGVSSGEAESSAQEEVPLEGLYFINPTTQGSERLNRLSADQAVTFALGDLDDDGRDEVIYALGNELYVKDSSLSPTNGGENADDEGVEFDRDLLGRLIVWKNQEYKNITHPFLDPKAQTTAAGATISFEPRNKTPYFEWIVSDRFDHRFEMEEEPKDRFSQKWHRFGFLQPASDMKILNIKGNPAFYTPELTSFSEGDILPENTRIKTGPNNEITLQIFDGTKIVIGQNETYQFKNFEADSFRLEAFQGFEVQENLYGSLSAWKEGTRSLLWGGFLHDPQIPDDTQAPVLSVKGGTKQKPSLLQEVIIDATESDDNQNLARVWWDLGEGRRFPETDEHDYTPRDLLTLKLPAFRDTEPSSIVLYAEDLAGNPSQLEIDFEVQVPDLQISDASVRSQRVAGQIKGEGKGIPVTLLRKRNQVWEDVLLNPLWSDIESLFEVTELSTQGGIELRDRNNKKLLFEILPNGRPVRHDDKIGFMIEPANKEHKFQIRIHDEHNQDLFFVHFIVDPAQGFVVSDLDEQDSLIWKSFASKEPKFKGALALVDEAAEDTVAMIDREGNIFLSENFSLGMKAAANLADPVIFQVRHNKNPVAEVAFPLSSEVWLGP